MAVGQSALGTSLDVALLDAVETRLEVRAVARCYEHAGVLRDLLALHRVHLQAGLESCTVAQVGLLLQLSESTADDRLREALLLRSLPGGLEALECGLLTVEQSAVLLRHLGGLDLEVRLRVWRRLQAKLLADLDAGSVLLRARLGGLLA